MPTPEIIGPPILIDGDPLMATPFQTTFKVACVLACSTAAGGALAAVYGERRG